MTMQTLPKPVRYPGFISEVRALASEHRKLADEPLLLAIYYAPLRDPQDIFLFEVIQNFGNGAIDSDRELFEVSYSSTSGFPLQPGQRLRLILTSPEEFAIAARENWPLVTELRGAIRAENAQIVFNDPAHPELMEQVNA